MCCINIFTNKCPPLSWCMYLTSFLRETEPIFPYFPHTINATTAINAMMNSYYSDVIMGSMAYLVTGILVVYSTVYSGADQRKHHSSDPGEFPSQRPVTYSFDVFFDLRPNKRSSKKSRRRWCETLSPSLWRHCNVISIIQALTWARSHFVPLFSQCTVTWRLNP